MPATRALPTEEAADLLRLDPRHRHQGARPAGGGGRGDRDLPARRVPACSAGRAAGTALPRGVRRRRPALRGLPAGARGDRRRVGVRRRRRQRARAVLLRAVHRAAPRSRRQQWLPDMLGGELLGAYCLSEPHAGSDPAAMTTRRVRDGDDYVHQRRQGLDHARRPRRLLQGDGAHLATDRNGISCFLVPGRRRGPHRRPARAQDGAHRLGDRHDALRRRPRPRRRAASAPRATA